MNSSLTSTYIFNQYYIDLLKKLKKIAKDHKHHSDTARNILKTIKENYQTYDKTSSQYIEFFKEKCTTEFWSSYIALSKDDCNDWFKNEDNAKIEIYKNITLKDVVKVLRNNFITHHYLSVLYIYTNDLSEEQITTILKLLQSVSEEQEIETEISIDNEDIKKVLTRLNELKIDNLKSNPTFNGMDSLKDTTIGKIAKEIMNDVDLSKIKQSINDEGDIFKAIAKPDSGFGELFTNVSQKMSSKISSGELSQEAIMKDAMKFASMLPGLFGGNTEENAGNAAGGFDMSSMMNMMNMMKAMNGCGGGGGGGKQRTGVNGEALRKLAKKQQLRKRLEKSVEKTDDK